ncbi:hypothetical protein VQL36_04980 [Chengkuizengella sp. SCS-71B]|uniref:hypothetical protein n=1 Tax=Chengkuizengella sp. SCS-71B TaxID=3115290 RepID=UPI0032C211F2
MGLKKGSFVVADTVSVDDPYDEDSPGVIRLIQSVPTVVATVDVCVKEPQKTQVSLDSMTQIAVFNPSGAITSVTFEVKYEVMRNGMTLATINDEMDYIPTGPAPDGRHTNFPNFPILDNNPSIGINTYDLVCTNVIGPTPVFVGSRSLKATVFEC